MTGRSLSPAPPGRCSFAAASLHGICLLDAHGSLRAEGWHGEIERRKKASGLHTAASFASRRRSHPGCGLPKPQAGARAQGSTPQGQGPALPRCLLPTSPPAPWAQHRRAAAGKPTPDLPPHARGPPTPHPAETTPTCVSEPSSHRHPRSEGTHGDGCPSSPQPRTPSPDSDAQHPTGPAVPATSTQPLGSAVYSLSSGSHTPLGPHPPAPLASAGAGASLAARQHPGGPQVPPGWQAAPRAASRSSSWKGSRIFSWKTEHNPGQDRARGKPEVPQESGISPDPLPAQADPPWLTWGQPPGHSSRFSLPRGGSQELLWDFGSAFI